MLQGWKNWQSRLNSALSWVLLAMAVLIVLNIVARYVWNRFTIMNYELILYLHIWVIFVSLSYAMQEKAHIGIDIIAARFSVRARALRDLTMGALLALPTGIVIAWLGGEYALSSWRIWEKSQETGGLDFVYISKSAIVVGGLLLLIQTIVQIAGAIATLRERRQRQPDQTKTNTDSDLSGSV